MTAQIQLNREFRPVLLYALEMAGAVALMAGAKLLSAQATGPTTVLVRLLPVLPVWLILFVSVRYYRRIDEFQRLKFLQAAALTAGITLCLHWSWPFIQSALGLQATEPDLSIPFSIVYVVVTAALTWARGPR